MKHKEKRMLFACGLCCILAGSTGKAYAQVTTSDTTKVQTSTTNFNNKEEKNRNVMLNAEGNQGPRNVNIGLPFSGDIIILENDVPVVYYFWPTIPTYAWRNGTSLSKMGLLSFAEGALTYGKVGYAVQSSDREASSRFKGYAQLNANSFGSSRYDITLTGPLAKGGWGYMLNLYQDFERGNGTNYMYTPWQSRTSMIKAALQKTYKNGYVRVLYKLVDSKSVAISNYFPVLYKGNGKTEELPNFKIGKDSYSLRTGLIPYIEPFNGESKWADLNDDTYRRSTSHNLYITGEHKFNKGYKLTYTGMWQYMNTPVAITFPISIGVYDKDQYDAKHWSFNQFGTNTPYTGAVQMVNNQIIPQSKIHYWVLRSELTKKFGIHSTRLGLTFQQNARKYVSYGGMFFQTVQPNPMLLDWSVGPMKLTDDHGLMSAAKSYGSYTNDRFSKIALYASDDFSPAKWLDLGLGLRIEHQNIKDTHSPYYSSKEFIGNIPYIQHNFNNKWNKVGIANAVVKLTRTFGMLADLTYNSWWDYYWDYSNRDALGNPIAAAGDPAPRTTVPMNYEQKVINYGAGIFWNLKNLSIVSKITGIEKRNIRYTAATIQNPKNPTEKADFSPIFYNIRTFGWSTDIVATPFKNFNIHFLLTLQNPQYKHFAYSAFNEEYSYNNKVIPELSKVLMEIDPSYSFMNRKMRAWVSLRYFGKQYGNPTNAFSYNAWWETFGGLDYRVNRNVNLKLQIVNFLNQRGAKGTVQGASQLKTDEAYINRTVIASAIRPRTFEFTVDIKF